jgi:hypothetical protein
VQRQAKRADVLKWKKSRRAAENDAGAEIQRRESSWAIKMQDKTEITLRDDPFMCMLKRAWDKAIELKAKWKKVNDDARERFVAEVLKVPLRR